MVDDPTIIDALSAELVVTYGVEIDPNIVSKIPFDSPLYDRLMGLPGNPHRDLQLAAVFALLTAADFTGSGAKRGSFPIGGDPPGLKISREMKSITKKSYGASSGLKDVHLIASSMAIAPHMLQGQRFRDDAEFLLNLLYVRTRQAIDYGIVRGNSGVYVNDFDGLETKVLEANHSQIFAAAGGTDIKSYIDQLCLLMMLKGITPTAIAANPVFIKAIVDAFASQNQLSINVATGQEDAVLGLWANRIVTPAGILPLIGDKRFSVSGTAPNLTGDVFVLTEVHEGEPILYLEWQVMPTALNLARVPGFYTSQVFAVWSHLCLVEKSDWYAQGRITDVSTTFTPTMPTISP